MIIFNSKEMDTNYVFEDEYVIEINSLKSPSELLQMLRDRVPITEEDASIHVYKTGEGKFVTAEDQTALASVSTEKTAKEYNAIYDSNATEEYTRAYNRKKAERNKIFQAFEAFQFNRPWKNFEFEEVAEVDPMLLKRQLYSVLGIMPTLRDHDKPISALQQMSRKGERLYRVFEDVTFTNHLPSIQDVEFYDTLNDYEKRVLHDSGVHPIRLMNIIRGIKAENPGFVFTKSHEDMARESTSDARVVFTSIIPGYDVTTYDDKLIKNTHDAKLLNYIKDSTGLKATEKSIDKLFVIKDIHKKKTDMSTISEIESAVNAYREEGISEKSISTWKKNAGFIIFARKMYEEKVIPGELLDSLKTEDITNRLVSWYKTMYKDEFLPSFEERDVTQKDGSVVHIPAGFSESDMDRFVKKQYEEPMHPQLVLAKEVFEAKFHGHAPKVLAEYMKGQAVVRFGKDFFSLSREEIEEIANGFDQKNVSKVAKYRNSTLFGIADKINFSEVKLEHMEALAVYLTPEKMKSITDKNFLKWYLAHKNTNTADFINLLNHIDQIKKFDETRTADELVFDINQEEGKRECRLMEQKYHYSFADNELAIRGRRTVVQDGKLKMYMLSPRDYRNFTIGIETHCCQRYGQPGESCVWKLTSDPFAAGVVIERDGEILAQAFTWVDESKDTLVFDNMEFKNDRDVSSFLPIIATWCREMPYKNIHMGMGYNTIGNSVGKPIEAAEEAKVPTTNGRNPLRSSDCHVDDGVDIYTDYHVTRSYGNKARALKRDNMLLIKEVPGIRATKQADEPTRWDVLARPETSFLLNDYRDSIEDRLAFARNFLNEQTPEIQMEAVKKNLQAIRFINNPTEEVQTYVINTKPELATLIANPCPVVQEILMNKDINYIRKIANPSEEMSLKAVKTNGLLLECIANPTENVIKEAVKQNGYAIKFIQRPTEEVQILAVKASPKVISMIPYASDNVKALAVRSDPHVLQLINNPSEAIQMIGVRADPYVVNEIQNPTYNVVKEAIKSNGLLIRNFQNQYPNLKLLAVKQNGFALRDIKDPTLDEVIAGIRQNRAASSCVRNPELLSAALNIVENRDHRQEEEWER